MAGQGISPCEGEEGQLEVHSGVIEDRKTHFCKLKIPSNHDEVLEARCEGSDSRTLRTADVDHYTLLLIRYEHHIFAQVDAYDPV